MTEMFELMWLEEIAWRMYGIEVEEHHEGNSHGEKT